MSSPFMVVRTKKEKQEDVKEIITKLTELKLSVIYEPVRHLFKQLQAYVAGNKSVKIDIEFPEIHKRIVGHLPVEKTNQCWVKLEKL